MSETPSHPAPGFHDPRMRGFRARATVGDVIELLDARVARLGDEPVPLEGAAGRVLGEAVTAGCAVPPFDRASMDGYAVRGEETYGADSYTPAVFHCKGKVRPGRAFEGEVGPGEAVEIATGAPIPAGADTVVPVEATASEGDRVSVHEAVPVGRHIGRAGEDVLAGTLVLPAGRVLRPQDLGVLSGLGVAAVTVVRRPVVTILITGDELLPPGTPPVGHRFADMNSPMLAALVARDGGVARVVGPIPDRRATLRDALADAARQSDLVLISGGSSTGPEDYAPGLVADLGELPVHGVALRPASPTGLGFVGSVPVLLLPCNPVSCLCAYDLFAGRAVRRLGGRPADWPYRPVELPLAHKLVSAVGRVDYARVKLDGSAVEPLAVSGASILSSTTRADGFVVVPADLEGYPAGARVTVWLYDG
jgi:molybdopterin molybdotransferase